MRPVIALTATLLLAGCVQPSYGPTQFAPQYEYAPQPFPALPEYRQPLPPPVPFPGPESNVAPSAEPQPLPAPAAPSENDTGPIPLQEMPAPTPDASSSGESKPQSPEPAPTIQKTPAAGPGSNVPLEGFRPMRGQTKPTP